MTTRSQVSQEVLLNSLPCTTDNSRSAERDQSLERITEPIPPNLMEEVENVIEMDDNTDSSNENQEEPEIEPHCTQLDMEMDGIDDNEIYNEPVNFVSKCCTHL
jgi:hypothetical protein